jgi:hypothetical protein
MTRLFYINEGPGRVSQAIEWKQNGKCRCCGKDFTPDEQIVSNGKRKKYYHRACALRLNILIPLAKNLVKKQPNSVIKGQEPRSNLLISLQT